MPKLVTADQNAQPGSPRGRCAIKPRSVGDFYVMRLDPHMLKRLLLAALLAAPFAAWAFLKPVRVLTPELNGVSCFSDTICTDNPSRYDVAWNLYQSAQQFVEAAVGPMEHKPRVIFCATDSCFQAFGLGRRSAATLGTVGIVVSPRAWQPHYVRHEMLHHIQNERLGSLKVWMVSPEWFVEGMAYSLSEDPRPVLSEPWQQDRTKFDAWFYQVGKDRLWEAADNL